MKKGTKMSPEAIAKIKEAKKNISEETRIRMSLAKKGRKPWNAGLTKDDPRVAKNTRGGWKHNEETKQIMRDKKLGGTSWNNGLSKATDDRVKNYSEKLRGIPKTEETKRLISASKKGQEPFNKGLTKETSEIVRQYAEKGSETITRQFEEGRIVWNKGLTKEIDDRISSEGGPTGQILGPRTEDIKEKIRLGNMGKEISTLTRQKLSINKIEYYKTHKNVWKGKKLPYKTWNKGLTKDTHPSMKTISAKRIEYMQTHPGNFVSTQEYKIRDGLKEIGLVEDEDFIPQYYVNNITHPYLADIYIPSVNLIIESEADYWHDMGERRDKDALRTAEMIANGMQVYRVLYSRVDKDFDNVMNEIISLLEDKNGSKE